MLPVSSPVNADDAVVLDQNMIRDEVRESSAGEAHDQQPSLEGNALRAYPRTELWGCKHP